MNYCKKYNKDVTNLDCLACYLSKTENRKGPGRCGFCTEKED